MTASAQESCTNTITNFQRVGSVYSFDIYAKSTGTTLRVGTCSFYLDFNFNALGSPTLTNVNPSYSSADGSTHDYARMVVEINSNKIAVRYSSQETTVGRAGTILSTSGTGDLFCTVNLTITDPAQLSGLTWDVLNSSRDGCQIDCGRDTAYAGSDNSLLPITLSSFVAMAQSNPTSVRW